MICPNHLPPLSLYIHIPWCIQKCPYCDFNSHPAKSETDERRYIDALLADLEQDVRLVQNRELQSIFIGGGTPSLFSGRAIGELLDGVSSRVLLASDIEITLEANPGVVEAEHFAAYRQAGVNRLSIGVQSFDAVHLQLLGRIHSPHEAVQAVSTAREAGFDNINLDLMFGLPDQTLKQAEVDLRQAISMAVEHISYYQLTLEPNTRFYHRPPELPDDDLLWSMQQQGEAMLSAAGYDPYEVSAYARSGRRCRHNLNYWQFGDYLGIGAGAHGKISNLVSREVIRMEKNAVPADYIAAGSKTADTRTLASQDLILEFMMNALRLNQGFTTDLFEARTGLELGNLLPELEKAIEQGLLLQRAGVIRPTSQGRYFLNELLQLFLK